MAQKSAELHYSMSLGNFSGYIDCDTSLEIKAEVYAAAPLLPANMQVSECRVFKWNILAIDEASDLKAICEFEPISKVEANGPESGEYLDAIGWENEDYVLSLGTDDGEYLNHRASENLIPKRFVTKDPDGLNWVKYTSKGFEINIPNLLKNEHIELRFSIAWKNKGADHDDISTWSAVDLALY